MPDERTEQDRPGALHGSVAALSFAALGVVFGDIGTSPLYALQTILNETGAHPSRETALGAFSLIFWTLIIITSVKYVALAMRVDNDGEGGILALMSLLGVKRHNRPFIVLIGLAGAALIYGDGAITPAISVLSALEGLEIISPGMQSYVLPLTVIILIALFAFQYQGTARIGGLFGPIMLIWFIALGILGVRGIMHHPSVLFALNPVYGVRYLLAGGHTAFAVLGGVFLCVTGAEALYADMGHFGRWPIRVAWSLLVMPSLALNYAGQAAIVLEGKSAESNTFFRLCPSALLVPMVILATVATIIASQAIITGAFSMTRQAVQLGWLPRLRITQTSAMGYGQIYVPAVNWLLMAATLVLAMSFKTSESLAAAYGIAVSLTMLLTTLLLFIAMREIWQWSLSVSLLVAGVFAVIDVGFFSANMLKVEAGGWVPLVMGGAVYAAMLIWHKGYASLLDVRRRMQVPLEQILARINSGDVVRVPGTAVFLTPSDLDVPPVLAWHVLNNRALHETVFILSVDTVSRPYVNNESRITVRGIAPRVWRTRARYGFMERPDVPRLVQGAKDYGYPCDPEDVVYYVRHDTIVASKEPPKLPRIVEAIFAFMYRNSAPMGEYFGMPRTKVVEMGAEFPL
jgi:KUP system potassium uptake protein